MAMNINYFYKYVWKTIVNLPNLLIFRELWEPLTVFSSFFAGDIEF